MMQLKTASLFFLTALAEAIVACPFCYQANGLSIGETKVMGNGIAYAWVQADKSGVPLSVGVTWTESALSGLPKDKPDSGADGYEIPLQLPKCEALKMTPYDHVALDWNPKGHIPPGIYDVPHFDVHFYMSPVAERLKITLEDGDMERCRLKPDAKYLPAGYIFAPESEAKYMGAHWVDTATPELSGKPFTHTFIYGTYNGKVVFWEPMVAMDYLLSKPNMTADIKQPKEFQKTGLYYPTKYVIHYDATRKEYKVAMEGFIKR